MGTETCPAEPGAWAFSVSEEAGKGDSPTFSFWGMRWGPVASPQEECAQMQRSQKKKKNDRFPLTFGMTKIRTILSITNQNKFHMDPESKCKTGDHKSTYRIYAWIFMGCWLGEVAKHDVNTRMPLKRWRENIEWPRKMAPGVVECLHSSHRPWVWFPAPKKQRCM